MVEHTLNGDNGLVESRQDEYVCGEYHEKKEVERPTTGKVSVFICRIVGA